MSFRTAALSLTVTVALAAGLAACSSSDKEATPTPPPATTSTPTPSPTPTETTPPEPTTADPVVSPIGDAQWQEIVDTDVWREGCPAGRDDLRRLDVNYVDYDGAVQRGAIVANADVMTSLSRIFTTLFEDKFPIARMEPVEKYAGVVDDSLAANNTSAFNCRRPKEINAPVLKSPHANGRAIDINPETNPWQDPRCKPCWSPSAEFAKRTPGQGKILKSNNITKLFESEGWIWQDISVADYMHFDTGFPSKKWTSPKD
ncbi:hypothetical protein BH09ACT10_BH09ACT10_08900 [soil metagenome]